MEFGGSFGKGAQGHGAERLVEYSHILSWRSCVLVAATVWLRQGWACEHGGDIHGDDAGAVIIDNFTQDLAAGRARHGFPGCSRRRGRYRWPHVYSESVMGPQEVLFFRCSSARFALA